MEDGEPMGDGEDELGEPSDSDDELDDAAAEAGDEEDDEPVDDRALARVARPRKAQETALSTLDPLAVYMREVQRHPVLSADDQRELAVKYTQTGDVEAAAKLVTTNLRLVVKLAYEYRRAYRNMMDLIQEGNIGLMQAVKRYDPYRGVKLSSYAAWWIRAYMLRFILNNWRLVKIGTTQAQRKLFFNLNKEKQRLASMGIEPTHEELAKRLDVDQKDVVMMERRLARGDASLDAPVGDSEGRQTSRLDLMPSERQGPDSMTESAELSDLVRQHLMRFRETLEGKEAVIFDLRTVAEDPLTLQELGTEFGVSRERVRQLEARMIGRLRSYLREQLGDAVEVDA
ncbi:MAG: RNA polymerase factor sigma-32 [Polyangiaceae bacterium]|nr:RNA polymerase factor sigma-32 [Polyangiaceae bacterium]MCW5792329.1 RNA polymerase factor sigma-32 [Polyangiaceae bacterium]